MMRASVGWLLLLLCGGSPAFAGDGGELSRAQQTAVADVAEALLESEDMVFFRVKNRFAEDYDAAPIGGYRDLQLLVYVKGTKLLLEVQLHLECMYKLKTSVAQNKDADGKTGHERYVEFRQLKEGAELL